MSRRLFSTLRILPRRQDGLEGPVAPLLGRPAGGVALHDEDLALGGVALEQSASFPGRARPSRAVLRMTRSRALRAASRARAAVRDFSTIRRASLGFSWKYSAR